VVIRTRTVSTSLARGSQRRQRCDGERGEYGKVVNVRLVVRNPANRYRVVEFHSLIYCKEEPKPLNSGVTNNIGVDLSINDFTFAATILFYQVLFPARIYLTGSFSANRRGLSVLAHAIAF
jgi:hypothetical protein